MNEARDQVVEWLAAGSKGMSSEAMAMWLGFGKRANDGAHPHDPADLDRCLRLLAVAPTLRPLLPRMADLSPYWAALVRRWEEIERSHLEEVGLAWSKGHSAPKTYELMRSILDPIDGADPNVVMFRSGTRIRRSSP